MAKKTPSKKVAHANRGVAQELRAFAKVYNNYKLCPLMHDLLRVLYPNAKRGEQRQMLSATLRRYRRFQKDHPEANLPELIIRKGKDGSLVAVPDGVLEQLAEFRVDSSKLRNSKGFIVTSAQFGATLNEQVWESFKRYAAHKGYQLLVLPIKYGAIKTVYQKELDKRVLMSTFDERLKGYMLFEDTLLANGMINLNTMRLRPTLMRFISAAVGQRGYNTSQIFASPKLELMHLPRLMHDYPKAAMTTGAVTNPNYSVDNLGQQDRTGAIAAAEHTYAAIVLEFSSKKTFHYRQLLSTSEGEFYDIDPLRGGAVYVTPNKIEHRPDDVDTAYLGDYHSGKTHPQVREITFGDGNLLQKLRPNNVILGDMFDGYSISHWDRSSASRTAWKGVTRTDSLEAELKLLISELGWMRKQLPKATLHVIASNHNEFLGRYLENKHWIDEPANMAFSARLFADLHDDLMSRSPELHEVTAQDPVKFWIDRHAPFVKTHDRQSVLLLPEGPDSKKINCSFHGDVGPSGARTSSMPAYREWNQWTIVGHNHSAAILGPVWRVGTCTHLIEHYVNGPRTKWTHTHALIYKNGQRQLINIVNGAWHGQRKKRPKSAGVGTGVRLTAKRPKKAASLQRTARRKTRR